MNFPTFTWNGGTYNCVGSPQDFSRVVEGGGMVTDKLLTATVRKYSIDEEGNTSPIFANSQGTIVYPQSQQDIIFSMNGVKYRIASVAHDIFDASFTMKCVSTVRGVGVGR